MRKRHGNRKQSVSGNFEQLEQRSLFSGGIDPTFGTGGYVVGTPTQYEAAAVQSDHKVIAVGTVDNGTNDVFSLTRYNTNGSVDTTFGTKGTVLTAVGNSDVVIFETLLVQPDGKIVAAGEIAPAGTLDTSGFAVVRYNSNGTLDTSFGTKGIVDFSGDSLPNLHWQNGKLLIGSADTIRRLNSNGTTDSTFKSGLPGASVLAVQSNGDIISEDTIPDGFQSDTQVMRYSPNGVLDTKFGTAGITTSALAFAPFSVVIESTGTIVTLETPAVHDGGSGDELVAVNTNGTIDNSFGTDGTVALNQFNGLSPFHGNAFTLLQQGDGKLVVTSTRFGGPDQDESGWQLARYSAAGKLDTSFGTGGTSVVDNLAGGFGTLDTNGRLYLFGGEIQNLSTGDLSATLFAVDMNNDAGSISGYMFYDFNGNGKRDAGDHQLHWTCYIDLDNDGHYDNADIRIYTDPSGNFVIPNLAPGVYHIRQSGVAGWTKTTPAEYTVTLKAGQTVTGINFGSYENDLAK